MPISDQVLITAETNISEEFPSEKIIIQQVKDIEDKIRMNEDESQYVEEDKITFLITRGL